MSETAYNWAALSITGLALASVSLLYPGGLSSIVQYSFFALAVILGILAVWQASRNTPTS